MSKTAANPKKRNGGIKALDVVSYYGLKNKLSHKAIRAMSGNYGKLKSTVHTGIVIMHNGELSVAEMVSGKKGGLKINPLSSRMNRIKGVTRFKFNMKEKKKIHQSILDDLSGGNIKYAKRTSPINYIFRRKDKKKLKSAICSEYVARKIESGSRYDVVKAWHRVLPTDFVKHDLIKKPNIKGSKVEFISSDKIFE